MPTAASHPTLIRAGTFLADQPALRVEWSLRLRSESAEPRDRTIFWVANPTAFSRIAALLADLDAPPSVLAWQAQRAPDSLRQGVGLMLGDRPGDEISLYVHHTDPATGREHYEAHKWQPGRSVERAVYQFHYLPMNTDDLIHTAQRHLYHRLMRDPRLSALSGYWLRHRGGQIDQISLTYPWQPPVRDVVGLDAAANLVPYHDDHVRHIAFAGRNVGDPALTLYFTGTVGTPWPADVAQLRQRVNLSARAASRIIESRILSRLQPSDFSPLRGCSPGVPMSLQTEAAMADRLIPRLQAVIPAGASVYIVGCGWGTVATRLWQTLRCRTVGITGNPAQHAHCETLGLRTRLGDPATCLPPGRFDTILLIDTVAKTGRLPLFSDQMLACSTDGTVVDTVVTQTARCSPRQ